MLIEEDWQPQAVQDVIDDGERPQAVDLDGDGRGQAVCGGRLPAHQHRVVSGLTSRKTYCIVYSRP